MMADYVDLEEIAMVRRALTRALRSDGLYESSGGPKQPRLTRRFEEHLARRAVGEEPSIRPALGTSVRTMKSVSDREKRWVDLKEEARRRVETVQLQELARIRSEGDVREAVGKHRREVPVLSGVAASELRSSVVVATPSDDSLTEHIIRRCDRSIHNDQHFPRRPAPLSTA
ncbi:hypothetical protein DIPPA_16590 [Diplonema papillatum]|nr:hypothetical protein DIPPA_16590 [Diplonema papillatum]